MNGTFVAALVPLPKKKKKDMKQHPLFPPNPKCCTCKAFKVMKRGWAEVFVRVQGSRY